MNDDSACHKSYNTTFATSAMTVATPHATFCVICLLGLYFYFCVDKLV